MQAMYDAEEAELLRAIEESKAMMELMNVVNQADRRESDANEAL